MPISLDTVLFYAVFIAPGFIAVMTVISLAAFEDEFSSFILLVWSLVVSLVIDTAFLALYQWFVTPITSFEQIPGILFRPSFQPWYVIGILMASFLLGVMGAVAILLDLPGGLRRVVQAKSHITFNPRQPWANFMRRADWVEIKTADNELYQGRVSEWSRAGRPRQVWLKQPQRYHVGRGLFEDVDTEYASEMLFLEEDIARLTLMERDARPSLGLRIMDWLRVGVGGARRWAVKRRVTGALVLGLAGWYVVQRLAAAVFGLGVVEPWFYFTPDMATGWLFAPVSHDMKDVGHLRRNLGYLLLTGTFAEPYLSRRRFVAVFAGLIAVSVYVPAVANLAWTGGEWRVAGPSGGVYGLWVFMAVYRSEILRSFWDETLIDDWGDLPMAGELVMVVVGLSLIVIVPVHDLFFASGSVNAGSHFVGLVVGFLLGFLALEWPVRRVGWVRWPWPRR